jgi:alcohol dehydrogenase
MFEREPGLRLARLRASATDSVAQRIRPTRPRMRALVLLPGGRLQWRSVPAPPPPGPLGAVVHPIAAATCDLDRPIVLGDTPFPTPLRYGHECVAEVLSVGSEVTSVAPGDRVIVPFEISCGLCTACRSGRTANCLAVPPLSMYGLGFIGGHWGGTIADELAVPFADGMLVPLPAGIDPAAAASVADNVPDGYRHIGPNLPGLLARGDEPRVIIIAGQTKRTLFTASVPLYAGLFARALGATNVVLIEARDEVRSQAQALGLEALTPSQAKRLAPAPLVVETSATPAGLRRALELTAPDGICSSSGSLHARSAIPTSLMYARNATLTLARPHTRPMIPDVLRLMIEDRFAPERVTTLTGLIDDAPAVLGEHMAGGSTKTILTIC